MSRSVSVDEPPVQRLLSRLQGVQQTASGWLARCPGHDDRKASLSIAAAEDGTVLVKCHAGCETARIVAEVGLELRHLFPDKPRPATRPARRLVATYDYRDEAGVLLYQVLRYEPKDFRQRVPDGQGGWIWQNRGTRLVLYRLPELLAAQRSEPVVIVEGEKDADRLAALGLVATTNPGGAGKWRPQFAEPLRGRQLVILPDHDAPGQAHARQVIRDSAGSARSVRVLELPGLPPKGDVSDWLDAGGTVAKLRQLADDAPLARDWLQATRSMGIPAEAVPAGCLPPPPVRPGPASPTQAAPSADRPPAPPEPAPTGAANPAPAETTMPGNGAAQAGEPVVTSVAAVPTRAIEWLWPGRLARGKLAILDGDPGLGKSLVTLDLCARLSAGRPFPDGPASTPAPVILVNCEDGVADTIRPRLEALDANLDRVHVLHGPPSSSLERLPAFPRDLRRLAWAIRQTAAALVVIDPIMAFLDETICSSNDQSVRQALAPLAVLADQTGTAVLLVRHLNKAGGAKAVYRGGGSIGIVGACRSAWLIGRNPNDENLRVLAQVKNNLARPQPSLGFEIVHDRLDRPQVAWLGTVELTADQLIGLPGAVEDVSEIERAAELLRQALANGPRRVAEVARELAREGVSRRTLYRARKEIGIESSLEDTPGGVQAVWKLAPPPKTASSSPGLEPLDLDLPPLE